MEYTIYLRTNLVNNKQYVGQTSDFRFRNNDWNCLKKTYANEHICNDREKYGLDNWTVEVLAETDSREDAWELEQRFINDYNTLWPNGYNIAKGGGGVNGLKHSEETKQKLSEAKAGENNPMFGTHHTDESKQKMSEAHKGKHPSDETKQKMSEAHKGKKQTKEHKEKAAEAKKIPVYQYTLDGKLVAIWPSAKNAAEKLGINRSSISECCHGRLKSAGGYIWRF